MMSRSFSRALTMWAPTTWALATWALTMLIAMAVCELLPGVARAQDVPGIEICTAEKTMERRTSCLQSNVNFLQKAITKLGLDSRQKIDAANRQIEALKSMVAELQKTVAEIQAAQKKQAAPAPAAKPAPAKEGAK